MQLVFESLKGVDSTVAGYAGGSADTAQYETVSTGTTGHAESVEITYDPARISFKELLDVYFLVAHDPTELDRQGPTAARNTVRKFFTRLSSSARKRSHISRICAPIASIHRRS